jgi:hypothetical protein
MKTILSLLTAMLPMFLISQTPMSIENLPNLTSARSAHVQLVTSPDKFVLIGGHVNGFNLTKNVEIYNSSTKTWQIVTTSDNRDMGFVAKLTNGKYLIGGGCSLTLGVGQLATTEIYNPVDNSFTAAANMSVARTNVCAATLKDGRVLVVGNWYNSASNAEVYNPVNNTFTLTGACRVERAVPVIIPTNDGGAIVCGGLGIRGGAPASQVFEKYDPITNSFSDLAKTLFNGETSWNIACYQPTYNEQFKMPNGNYAVLVYNSSNTLARLISIDPATSKIDEIVTQTPIPLIDPQNSSLSFGCQLKLMIDPIRNLIHIIQVSSNNSDYILRLVTVNPVNGSVNFTKMDGFDFNTASCNLSMLSDGRILFTGGNKPDNFTLSPRAFIITPATYTQTGTFSPSEVKLNAYWDNQKQRFLFNEVIESATLYSIAGKALFESQKSRQLLTNSLSSGVYIVKVKRLLSNEMLTIKVLKP